MICVNWLISRWHWKCILTRIMHHRLMTHSKHWVKLSQWFRTKKSDVPMICLVVNKTLDSNNIDKATLSKQEILRTYSTFSLLNSLNSVSSIRKSINNRDSKNKKIFSIISFVHRTEVGLIWGNNLNSSSNNKPTGYSEDQMEGHTYSLMSKASMLFIKRGKVI